MSHTFLHGRLRLRRPAEAWRDRLCREVFVQDEIDLLIEWRLVPHRGGVVEWPGDGTLLALWEYCQDKIIRGALPNEFARFRHVREVLCVGPCLASDAVLMKVADFAAPGNPTEDLCRHLLGVKAGRGGGRRLRVLQGRGRKDYPKAAEGSFADLLELFPYAARDHIREAFAQEVIPALELPSALHMGRVLALRGEAARLLGACRILEPYLDGNTPGSSFSNLARVERFDEITMGFDQRSAIDVAAAIAKYRDGELFPIDPRRTRQDAIVKFARDVRAAAAWARLTLGDQAEAVIDRLPQINDDVVQLSSVALKARGGLDKGSRKVQVAELVELAPRMMDMLVACENRVTGLFNLALKCASRADGAQLELAAGHRAGFSWLGPVIRPDGSLGDGEQRVRMEFVRGDVLARRAAERNPDDPVLAALFKRVVEDPARSALIHIIYVGTTPTQAAGEHHEPWFVDLFRCGVIGSAENLGPELAQRRNWHLQGMRRGGLLGTPDDLLGFPHLQRATLNEFRRSDPFGCCVAIPLLPLLHAMLIARIVLRMSLRWGARIGETKQLRSGCIFTEEVDGRLELFASLKPKGWTGQGVFDIDEATVEDLKVVKSLAIMRWSPNCVDEFGKSNVPVVEFGSPVRKNLAPERYILRTATSVLRTDDLLNFVRVLMAGVVDLRSHRGRFLFATALGLMGNDYKTIGGALKHSEQSLLPAHYDLSPFVNMIEDAKHFNSLVAAGQVGRVLE